MKSETRAFAGETETAFQALFSTNLVGIVILDANGRHVEANERFCRMLGYSVAELASMKPWDLSHPEDRLRDQEMWLSLWQGTALHSPLEKRYVRKDGQIVWAEVEFSLVRPGQGENRYATGIVHDITQRYKVEGELRQASAHAERANRAKSRFLAAASHDLRQPLAALTLYTDALRARVMQVDRPLVDSMRECLGSLNSLLTDLLDLSKLEAGVVKPNINDFGIRELLDNLTQAYLPEAEVKGLRLRVVASGATVKSDKVLLRRIVGNFVANAIRYTAKGSVLIGCRRRGDMLSIEVWDTGIGIPDDKLDAIFEEFRQLDEARPQGSGLGLAIAAKTASLLKSHIRVQSRVGEGSVFSVAVPIGCSTEVRSAKKPAVDLMLRIALVEDNDHVRDALALALAANGHKVVAAPTIREIKKRLGKRAPDVVIADYRLAAQETGIEAIGQLREMFGQELPGVLITGDTDPHLLRSMSDHDIVVQHKPIQIDVLQRCITGLARGRPEGLQGVIDWSHEAPYSS